MPRPSTPLKLLVIHVCLALVLASATMAQTFNVISNSASMGVNLAGDFVSEFNPGPFSSINWNDSHTNATGNYLFGIQTVSITSNSMSLHMDLGMYGRVTNGYGTSANELLSIAFTVSQPTTVSFSYDQTGYLGIGYDGSYPVWGVTTEGPVSYRNGYSSPTLPPGTLLPGQVYYYFDVFDGYVYEPATPYTEGSHMVLDMNLTATPEPSSLAMIGLAAIPLAARKIKFRRKPGA